MSTFDDSSFEMHDDSLTPDTAERLLDGEILSPEFADLAAMVNDVRTTASSTPTPAVRGALAEYVGVGLTATESSAEPPAPAAVSSDLDLTSADQQRSRSVFAEVLTFAGTVTGKLLLGGAVAVASVSGAQATGIVDLPGLPDKPETVVVADKPIDDAPAELPLDDKADEAAEETDPKPKPEPTETDKPEVDFAAEFEEAKDKAEEEAKEAAEKAAAEKEAEEKAAAEKEAAEKEAAEKAAAEKEAAEKAEAEKKDKEKEEEPSEAEAALLAQLLADKEAVYAAASALIQPLEAEKKPLVDALNATLGTLEEARNAAKAPLYAELEITEDEERRVEIEAELSAIFEQWELDRDAAKAEANPAINAINVQLENIEIERDAEIGRLLEQYRADLEAL